MKYPRARMATDPENIVKTVDYLPKYVRLVLPVKIVTLRGAGKRRIVPTLSSRIPYALSVFTKNVRPSPFVEGVGPVAKNAIIRKSPLAMTRDPAPGNAASEKSYFAERVPRSNSANGFFRTNTPISK